MNRRQALQAIVAALTGWTHGALAQQQGRIPVLAVPLIFAGPDEKPMQDLRRGLRERGWVDGQNIRIEHRWTQGKVERLPEIIRELIALQPDVYVGAALVIVRALKEMVGSVPIVAVGYDYDPVAAGLVKSLSRPGGTITGIYSQSLETSGKRLELLRDMLPRLKRAAVLYDRYGQLQLEHFSAGARMLGIALQPIEIGEPYDYHQAFKRAVANKANAVAVAFSPRFFVDRELLAKTALKYRMPTVYDESSRVVAGGLMSYGPDRSEMFGRVPYFVDRILKGASPGDLPVEQPTRYHLWLNLKTAKALGLTIPETVMVRVDEVIR